MNKCEIIERLKNIAKHAVHTAGEEPFVMSLDDGIAVNEAIELLKKPETSCSEIPNESDTISLRAAIAIVLEYDRRLCKHIGTPEDKEMYAFGRGLLLSIERDLKQLPSAQPERKKGHWKLQKNGNAICSECGFVQVSAWDLDNWDNFCHHCGADMRGKQDG